MILRSGRPDDIPALNELALAAKAFWGYTPQQLESLRSDLQVHPALTTTHPVCLVEQEGRLAGFVQLDTQARPWEISGLWVHPDFMRQGIGRVLLEWSVRTASTAACKELHIDSEPNAEGFYLACGARRVGATAAPLDGQPDRLRPQLVLPLCRP